MAALGPDATGVGLAAGALQIGGQKARERGLTGAVPAPRRPPLAELGEVFDTVLASLVLHGPAAGCSFSAAATAAGQPRGAAQAVRAGRRVLLHRR
jgi:hypothetical protein